MNALIQHYMYTEHLSSTCGRLVQEAPCARPAMLSELSTPIPAPSTTEAHRIEPVYRGVLPAQSQDSFMPQVSIASDDGRGWDRQGAASIRPHTRVPVCPYTYVYVCMCVCARACVLRACTFEEDPHATVLDATLIPEASGD